MVDRVDHMVDRLLILGAVGNTQAIIRIGSLTDMTGIMNTANTLHVSIFRDFWVSWSGGMVRVGTGLQVGQNVITDDSDSNVKLEKAYPSTIDINYLSLFNGYGADGDWHLYKGNYFKINYLRPLSQVKVVPLNISLPRHFSSLKY